MAISRTFKKTYTHYNARTLAKCEMLLLSLKLLKLSEPDMTLFEQTLSEKGILFDIISINYVRSSSLDIEV